MWGTCDEYFKNYAFLKDSLNDEVIVCFEIIDMPATVSIDSVN